MCFVCLFVLFRWGLGWRGLTSGRKQVQLYLQRVKILGSPEPGTHGMLFHPCTVVCRATLSALIPKEEQTYQGIVPKWDFDEERLGVASSLTHPEHNPGLCSGTSINTLMIFEKRKTGSRQQEGRQSSGRAHTRMNAGLS